MDDGFIFGNFLNIWDADKNERVTINFGTCRKSISSSYILTLWSGKLHYGFNWSYEWKLWVAKTILSSSTCEVLRIIGRNKGFLALQVSIVEWRSGPNGDRTMSCDNGWGE